MMKRIVLVGYPLEHSMSPLIQNTALRIMGLHEDYRYEVLPLRGDELPGLVTDMMEGTTHGANVTMPYKAEILSHIHFLDDRTWLFRSANTLYRTDSGVAGTSTDGIGFKRSLTENGVSPRGMKVLILGAGGMARAVVDALLSMGVDQILIRNRTIQHALQLRNMARAVSDIPVEVSGLHETEPHLDSFDVVVNCTSLGMRGTMVDESPIHLSREDSHLIVVDTVYNPVRTVLIREAMSMGCKTVDGTGTLVHQAAESLRIWFGRNDLPIDAMREALLRELGEQGEIAGT